MVSPLAALQQLAGQLEQRGHPVEAIKCLEACLRLSPMRADEAQARLRAARLLLHHTSNLSEAKQHLQKAVSRCVALGCKPQRVMGSVGTSRRLGVWPA